MVDSNTVLWGQTIVYTLYVVAILIVMGWFVYNIVREGEARVRPWLFYTFTGFLIVLGVSLHIVTYNTIPWAPLDINRAEIEPDKVFAIEVEDHQFTLPAERLMIDCGDKVIFDVTSNDLTYGFGLFRANNSMVTQMQVVPGHVNDLMWEFNKNGVYDIRSTEYSGPEGFEMIVEDAVEVSGCEVDDV